MRILCAIAITMIGCHDRRDAPDTHERLATSPVPDAPAPRDAVAVADATPTTIAPTAPAPAAPLAPLASGWIDSPPWPSGDQLDLTWQVTQVLDGTDPESSKEPVELVATIGGVSRHLRLAPQLGALSPLNEPMCAGKLGSGALTIAYPLAAHEVAELTFYEGGAGGYVVRRQPASVLTVVAWDQGDGACARPNGELTACPRRRREVARLHVPPGVTIRETIVEIDPHGARLPFTCENERHPPADARTR